MYARDSSKASWNHKLPADYASVLDKFNYLDSVRFAIKHLNYIVKFLIKVTENGSVRKM